MYERVAESCFRFLGINDFDKIDRLTIKEFNIAMQAQRLKEIDDDFKAHGLAWAIVRAGATKTVGNKTVSAYRSFNNFYDYKKELAKVEKKELSPKMARYAEFLKGQENGRI